ncbi:minor capsid protein [Gordonia Phage Barsten]|uniref:Minor capsid protein n=1 Tax=Gordonia Phage Barsten TaxID=2743907 RepID=A0A7G3V990_9CAUD|nr:head morphogenesis [Gordonia Phage Barsten]QKY78371.1 minor capsid protein [Gordonia Phage Barsten]
MATLERRRAEHQQLLRRAERGIDAAVLAAIDVWLTAVRFALVDELVPRRIVADAEYAVDAAVQRTWGVWQNQLENQVLPTVSVAFGDAFQQVRRADPQGAFAHQQQYLAEVSDRLRIWPAGAFEDIRPELLESLSDAVTIDEMTERVGRVLNIDAKSRKLRAQINDVEAQLADPDLDPADRPALTQWRRDLWEQHDESLNEWQWKARRIARTESHGAVSAGQLAAARVVEQQTGLRMWKRWLSTEDQRTRASHRVADGQTCPLDQPFRVGGFLLEHPADSISVAPHEVINCLTDPDTPIETDRGPKRIADIRPGDRVLTHRGRYRDVLRVAPQRDYTGDVVRIDAAGQTLRVTLNHPILTQRGWVVAGEVVATDVLYRAAFVEHGDRLGDLDLLGIHTSGTVAATTTDAERPRAQQVGMVTLDNEIVANRVEQFDRLPIADLPPEHARPVLAGGFLPAVDNADAGEIVQELNHAAMTVHAQDARLVVERPGRVFAAAAHLPDSDGSLPVDEGGNVGGGNRIEFHRTIVPTPVAHLSREQATDVQLYNFAVDEDESYIAAGIAVHNCRCTMLIYDDDELQDEFDDQGGKGPVEPGAVRIGPDDPDAADAAILQVAEREKRATPQVGQRGEDYGQQLPAQPLDVELTDERTPIPVPDLETASDQRLADYLIRTDERDGDPTLRDEVDAELSRRREAEAFEVQFGQPEYADDVIEVDDDDAWIDQFIAGDDDVEVPEPDPDYDPDLSFDEWAAEPDEARLPDDAVPADPPLIPEPLDFDEGDEDWVALNEEWEWVRGALHETIAEGSTDYDLQELIEYVATLESARADLIAKAATVPDVDPIAAERAEYVELWGEAAAVAEFDPLHAPREETSEDRRRRALMEQADQLAEDRGISYEQALAEIQGLDPDQVRRREFVAEGKRQGLVSTSYASMLDELHNNLSFDWLLMCEDATNGQTLKPRSRDLGQFAADMLWKVNDNTARKHMSDEAALWFDQNGRITKADLGAMIEDGRWAFDAQAVLDLYATWPGRRLGGDYLA